MRWTPARCVMTQSRARIFPKCDAFVYFLELIKSLLRDFMSLTSDVAVLSCGWLRIKKKIFAAIRLKLLHKRGKSGHWSVLTMTRFNLLHLATLDTKKKQKKRKKAFSREPSDPTRLRLGAWDEHSTAKSQAAWWLVYSLSLTWTSWHPSASGGQHWFLTRLWWRTKSRKRVCVWGWRS